jgi:fatty-acyl-CoA synthase
LAPSIIELLERGARLGGSLTVINTEGEESTDSLGLIQEAAALGASLQSRGIGPGDRVGLLAVTTMDFVRSLLAVLASQACAVLLPAPPIVGRSRWVAQLERLTRGAQVSATAGPPLPPLNEIPHISLSNLPGGSGPEVSEEDGDGLILFTSGTTGDPRGVVLSRDRTRDRVQADVGTRDFDPRSDVFLGWRDLGSSGGLFPGLLTPLAAGGPSYVLDTRLFSRSPERWLQEVSRRRVTVSGGPNYAYGAVAEALTATGGKGLDLSSWRIAECAGERIDVATIEAFVALARPLGFDPSSFVPLYALTEAGILSVTESGRGLRRDPSRDTVSSGKIRQGVTVDVLDDTGLALPEGEVGHLNVRSPWLMLGYLDRQETERRLADGRFDTGDLGYVERGELYITGRAKNVIIVGGRNYNGEDLERSLYDIEGLVRNGVAVIGRASGSTEEIVVFAETQAEVVEHSRISRAIRSKLWTRFLLRTKDVVLVEPGSLPRTAAGKLRREELKTRPS